MNEREEKLSTKLITRRFEKFLGPPRVLSIVSFIFPPLTLALLLVFFLRQINEISVRPGLTWDSSLSQQNSFSFENVVWRI